MDKQLDGLAALVTGGGSGLGLEVAKVLAARGAQVAVTDIDAAGLARARQQVPGVLAIEADNRAVAAVVAAVAEVEGTFGKVDILVNNAGISGRSLPLEEVDEAAFDDMFATHVKGAFFFARAAVPGMKARRFGRIVNISSEFNLIGSPAASHYTGAKGALSGLARAWALELAPHGITANAVAPGLMKTPMTLASVGAAEIERRTGDYPLGRLATPEEVAYAVAWLAGPEAAMMTGQTVSPNGGIAIVGL